MDMNIEPGTSPLPATIALFVALLLCSHPLLANDACPVDMVQAGSSCNGGVCVPVCVYPQAPPSFPVDTGPAGPVSVLSGNWTLVRWEDAKGKPGYSLGADLMSAVGADAVAMRKCANAGRRHCRIHGRYDAGILAVARAADGGLFFHVYDYPQTFMRVKELKKVAKSAKKKIVEECAAALKSRCKFVQVVPSDQWAEYNF
jgi:hypothetical protein